jgi:hypothetical protein
MDMVDEVDGMDAWGRSVELAGRAPARSVLYYLTHG